MQSHGSQWHQIGCRSVHSLAPCVKISLLIRPQRHARSFTVKNRNLQSQKHSQWYLALPSMLLKTSLVYRAPSAATEYQVHGKLSMCVKWGGNGTGLMAQNKGPAVLLLKRVATFPLISTGVHGLHSYGTVMGFLFCVVGLVSAEGRWHWVKKWGRLLERRGALCSLSLMFCCSHNPK